MRNWLILYQIVRVPSDVIPDTALLSFAGNQEISCPLCGVECDQQEMTWSDTLDQPCCLGCLAEEESCGCSDD